MRPRIARLLRRCADRLDHRHTVTWSSADPPTGSSYNTAMQAARDAPPVNWRDL